MPSPRETALASHADYYQKGSYDDDRLIWTLDTFISSWKPQNALEVGCGDGAMLRLLTERGIPTKGVDASSSGVDRAVQKGVSALCMDVSSEHLPFAEGEFDLVICLEVLEHLTNPYFAVQEIRRVLASSGRFLCSVPNPLTGHPFLYPGLFEYANFRSFLEQSGFRIERVSNWQWAPRETILPLALRRVPVLNSRIVAGGLRRIIEKSYRAVGAFPAFCYWLWTFDCVKDSSAASSAYEAVSLKTRPGSGSHFAARS